MIPAPGPTGSPLGQPKPRESHGLAFDRVRNVLVLHGGGLFVGGTTNARAGETWELDVLGRWRLRAVGPPGSGLNLPDHRSMAFDLHRGTTLLLTARNAAGALSGQLWEWAGTSWLPIGNLPMRTGAAMAYDEARRRTVIVGGADFFSFSDVWEWRYVDPVNSGSCRTP